jgi:hypothetical protein
MSTSSARLCVNCRFFHTEGERRALITELSNSSRVSGKPQYEDVGSVLLGECRAMPPEISYQYPADGDGVWPRLKADQWCGHWQAAGAP